MKKCLSAFTALAVAVIAAGCADRERASKPVDHSIDIAAWAATAIADTQTVDTTWSVSAQFNPDVTYGLFTDGRDGKIYRTVEIGTQTWMAENLNNETGNCYDDNERNCQRYGRLYSWSAAMAACPAGWRLPSDADWTVLRNAVSNSSTTSKRLKAAFGWHNLKDGTSGNGTDDYGFSALPSGHRYYSGGFSDAEWAALTNAVAKLTALPKDVSDNSTASKKLKSINLKDSTSGNGTGNYGFSALSGGDRQSDSGGRPSAGYYFYAVGRAGYWWSATTASDSSFAWYRGMEYFTGDVDRAWGKKANGYAVRCIKGGGAPVGSAGDSP